MQKKPTFAGEVQFAGYADGSRGGPRITLRLADREDLEKFIGMEGKRFMVAFMEIGDDEQPVAAPTPAPAVKRERMAPLCEWAVTVCRDPMFQTWAISRMKSEPDCKSREDHARSVIVSLCGVESRKHLDTNPAAASALHELVRKPYAAWREKQAVTA